jgi:hypothetical protein
MAVYEGSILRLHHLHELFEAARLLFFNAPSEGERSRRFVTRRNEEKKLVGGTGLEPVTPAV